MEATLRPLGYFGVVAYSVSTDRLLRCFWLAGRHVAVERLECSRSDPADLGERIDAFSGDNRETNILTQLC